MNDHLSGTSCHSSSTIPVRWWCMQMQTLLHDNLQLLILIHASTEISQLVIQFASFFLVMAWDLRSIFVVVEIFAVWRPNLLIHLLQTPQSSKKYTVTKKYNDKPHKSLMRFLFHPLTMVHFPDFFSQKLFQHRGCFCMAVVEQLRDDGRW